MTGAQSSTDITVEPLRWWDIEAVARLESQLFPHDPWSVEAFWGELARVPETRTWFVARRAAAIVGYAGLYAVTPDADVQTIAVAPSTQGTGLGSRLLAALVTDAAERGCTRLFLEVREGNTAARKLYDRNGFEVSGRRRRYYPDGEDAVLMTRRLVRS